MARKLNKKKSTLTIWLCDPLDVLEFALANDLPPHELLLCYKEQRDMLWHSVWER